MKENVAILGASDRPDRFAYKALKLLQQYGHQTFPVNPTLKTIEGAEVAESLTALKGQKIDTLTLYVNPQRLAPYVPQILELKPRRVIFNPGTESREIEKQLQNAGIEPIEACTLVMLNSGTF